MGERRALNLDLISHKWNKCVFLRFSACLLTKEETLQIYRARRLKFQESLFEKSEMFEAHSLQNPARTLEMIIKICIEEGNQVR